MAVNRALHSRAVGAVVLTGVLLASDGLTSCNENDGGAPPTPPGWTVEFLDDFEGPAGTLPSSEHWRLSLGTSYPDGPPNWGTGEVTVYTDDPANVSLNGEGQLEITPLRDRAGEWTSARLETNRQDFRPPPGGALRVESRLQLPDVTGGAALGYWSAFWALGEPYRDDPADFPVMGEIDIMENANGLDEVWGVLHCGPAEGGPCEQPDGLSASTDCPDEPCAGSFHTFTFEWDTRVGPAELRWAVDGEVFHTVSEADIPADVWQQFTGHEGYFLLLNLAIGGGFPDAMAQTTTPTSQTQPGHPLIVDYVAVWTTGAQQTGAQQT